MSEPDAVPLPREGEVFFDVRGDARCLRLSWYADTAIAVFSIWQGNRCTGTFRLPFNDLERMARVLQSGPEGAAVTGRPGGGHLDRAAGGFAPSGHGPSGYGPSGYGPSGYRPSAGRAPGERAPDSAVPSGISAAAPGYGTGEFGLPDYDPPNYSDSPWQAGGAYPADPGYSAEPRYDGPSYQAQPSHPAEPRYDEPGYPAEPRYGELGYAAQPSHSAEPRYDGPGYPAEPRYSEPSYPAEQGYPAEPRYSEPGYPAGQGYPARAGWDYAPEHGDAASAGWPAKYPRGEGATGLRAASAVYAGHVTASAAPSYAPEADDSDLTSDWSTAGYPPEPPYPAPAANSRADSGRSVARYAGP